MSELLVRDVDGADTTHSCCLVELVFISAAWHVDTKVDALDFFELVWLAPLNTGSEGAIGCLLAAVVEEVPVRASTPRLDRKDSPRAVVERVLDDVQPVLPILP